MSQSMTLADANQSRSISNLETKHIEMNIISLNELLANEYAIFTKTLSYHWNVTGPRFHSIHKFLEEHYNKILQIMDKVAERVRVLGGTPLSTVSNLAHTSTIKDSLPGDSKTDMMINDLFRDHQFIQNQIKVNLQEEEIFTHDPATEDFLVGILKEHEMMSWMLKSHLNY